MLNSKCKCKTKVAAIHFVDIKTTTVTDCNGGTKLKNVLNENCCIYLAQNEKYSQKFFGLKREAFILFRSKICTSKQIQEKNHS